MSIIEDKLSTNERIRLEALKQSAISVDKHFPSRTEEIIARAVVFEDYIRNGKDK